jgi:hypothetical protein
MDERELAEWSALVARLTEKLADSPMIYRRAPEHDEPPEVILAHNLADIDEECRALTSRYLPSILNAASPDELDDALIDLRVGLQHLVYHIRHDQFLRLALD